MKKSLPSDDSFNFASSSHNRLVQLNPRHKPILSQIPTWLLPHSHPAPPLLLCWWCQILSLAVVFINHPKPLLHTQRILPKVAQQDTLSLHRSPGQGGTALPCHLQPVLGSSCSPMLSASSQSHHSPWQQLAETVRKRELQLHGKGGCYREAAQILHRRVIPS